LKKFASRSGKEISVVSYQQEKRLSVISFQLPEKSRTTNNQQPTTINR